MADEQAAVPVPRVVLITGAAGGLGQELSRQFAEGGWRVAMGYHRQTPVLQGDLFHAVSLDVTDATAVASAVTTVLDRWHRLDVLVNNAGITADALSWQLTEDDWDRVLDVNLKGAFLCAQAALQPMLRQRDGHILNIGSFSGRAGQRGQANYAAAKAGLLGLTESLAREVGSRNIRVNAVLPGVLPTAMTAKLGAEQKAAYAAANALGRINSLAEVARFVVFLAALQNVSGQSFQLDSRIVRWT